MPTIIRASLFALITGFLLATGGIAAAQANYYNANGVEYAIATSLPGDQMFSSVAIATNGGFAVWQDNVTDGDNWGISASRLDKTLSGTFSPFRVNASGAGTQENPQAAMLKNGGAVFAWQGGKLGRQHIYARFLTATNTFVTPNDVLVCTFTNNFQINPAVTVLKNGNVVFIWSSYNQARSNSMQDVYGQIFSPVGKKVGNEFLVNQFTTFNQRTPAVTALAGGGFVVTWVSEQERKTVVTTAADVSSANALLPSVDIYARLFKTNGTAAGNEFLVNTDNNPCANPVVAAADDGSFLIAWAARDLANPDDSFDIHARAFSSTATGGGVFYVNTRLHGDQYIPRVSALGSDYLIVWTSLGQDGSREGIYGQLVHDDGTLVGGEFLVNTTTFGQQLQPAVASDGEGQFLVLWSSFTGFPNTFDLFAQRYLNASETLQPMSAPFVYVPFVVSNSVYRPQLVVSWPVAAGLKVANYEVYADGAASPMGVVTSNEWTMTSAAGLTTNSIHSFRLAYVLAGGKRSPLSASASGTTWNGLNWNEIPYEWMASHYGGLVNGAYHTNKWPAALAALAAGGPALSSVFRSGGNPLDSTTWLRTTLTKTSQGMFLNWKTQPGAMYQVQVTANLTSWSNVGSPRFAAGTADSLYIGGNAVGYYRVLLLR